MLPLVLVAPSGNKSKKSIAHVLKIISHDQKWFSNTNNKKTSKNKPNLLQENHTVPLHHSHLHTKLHLQYQHKQKRKLIRYLHFFSK